MAYIPDPNTSSGGSSLGTQVSRPAGDLPQSTAGTLFTISGGRVWVKLLLGEVTTVIGVTTNSSKIILDREVVGSPVDLTNVLDIRLDVVGTYYTLDNSFTNLRQAAGYFYPNVISTAKGWLLGPGDIQLDCPASETGQIKWDLWYTPLDAGATVVAV